MKYEITAACGHTVTVDIYGSAAERERKVKWYENNYICDECRDAENAEGCEEVEMSYAEYKTNYADCKTKKNSYDKKTKTIIVYVPVVEDETAETAETAEEAAVEEIVKVSAESSPLSADERREAARKMLTDRRTPEELALWREQIAAREPSSTARVMIAMLNICEKYWRENPII